MNQSLLEIRNAPIWRKREPTHLRLSGTDRLNGSLSQHFLVVVQNRAFVLWNFLRFYHGQHRHQLFKHVWRFDFFSKSYQISLLVLVCLFYKGFSLEEEGATYEVPIFAPIGLLDTAADERNTLSPRQYTRWNILKKNTGCVIYEEIV